MPAQSWYNILSRVFRAPKRSYASAPDSETYYERGIQMYAIIATGGKQYKVEVGDALFIEKLGAEAEDEVTFDQIVALGTDEGIKAGMPTVEGASVAAKVLKNGRGKKITVFTYKAKKNEKRKMGHRQPYTKVEITAINAA